MAGSSTAVALQDEKPQGPFTGSHMLNVKNARLRSEHDVTLLRNRLERLRQEERKALKKIEETRRRADQIVSLKTRNEENHMRKALEADYSKKQLERARQRLQGHKDMQQEAIRETAAMVAAQKKQEADMLRQQRQLIQEHVNEQKSKHVARAQQINTVRADCGPSKKPRVASCRICEARGRVLSFRGRHLHRLSFPVGGCLTRPAHV